jgi:hypothetical protein
MKAGLVFRVPLTTICSLSQEEAVDVL